MKNENITPNTENEKLLSDYVNDNLHLYDCHICCCCETCVALFRKGYYASDTTTDANACPFAFWFRMIDLETKGLYGFYCVDTSIDENDSNSMIILDEIGERVFEAEDNGGGYNIVYCRAFKEAPGIRKTFNNASKIEMEKRAKESERNNKENSPFNSLTEDLPFE